MDICASTHWITLRASVFLPLSHILAYTYALRCVYVCVCMDAQTLAWNKVQNENGIVMSLQQQLGWWVRKPWKISPTCYVTFTIFFLVPHHLLGLSTLGSIPDLWPGTCDTALPHLCTFAVRRGHHGWHREDGTPGASSGPDRHRNHRHMLICDS